MGMETIAIILLVLFTLEIIFIFVYSSQKDDSKTDEQGWGPPELPTPPSTNVFEFPEGPHGYFPDGPHGKRPGRWDDDDDDYDFDDDYKRKDKLKKIKFILSKNHDFFHSYDSNAKEVTSDFRNNDNKKEFTVHLDKIDYDNYKDNKLFMTYRPTQLTLKWWFVDEKDNIIGDKNTGGDKGIINLGLLSKLKTQANGNNLILKIKVKNEDRNRW